MQINTTDLNYFNLWINVFTGVHILNLSLYLHYYSSTFLFTLVFCISIESVKNLTKRFHFGGFWCENSIQSTLLQNSKSGLLLPEKVHFTIELSVSGEALLGEVAVAVTALDALSVPGSVQHVEEEPVQDGPFAPGTVDHHVSGLQDAECRPSRTDCAARTEATRVYAEQRLGSGRCAVRQKLEESPVQR